MTYGGRAAHMARARVAVSSAATVGAGIEYNDTNAMAQEALEQFCRLVLADAELQAQLWQTPARGEFVALVVRLGAERGCVFTHADVEAALQTGRRAWLERWV